MVTSTEIDSCVVVETCYIGEWAWLMNFLTVLGLFFALFWFGYAMSRKGRVEELVHDFMRQSEALLLRILKL